MTNSYGSRYKLLIAYQLLESSPIRYIECDYVGNRSVSLQSRITEYPIQTGKVISDHKYDEPNDISVSIKYGINSNNTFKNVDYFIDPEYVLEGIGESDSIKTDLSFLSKDTNKRLASIELLFEYLKNSACFCTLYFTNVSNSGDTIEEGDLSSRFTIRKGYVIESLSFKEGYDTLNLDVNFKQIQIANPKVFQMNGNSNNSIDISQDYPTSVSISNVGNMFKTDDIPNVILSMLFATGTLVYADIELFKKWWGSVDTSKYEVSVINAGNAVYNFNYDYVIFSYGLNETVGFGTEDYFYGYDKSKFGFFYMQRNASCFSKISYNSYYWYFVKDFNFYLVKSFIYNEYEKLVPGTHLHEDENEFYHYYTTTTLETIKEANKETISNSKNLNTNNAISTLKKLAYLFNAYSNDVNSFVNDVLKVYSISSNANVSTSTQFFSVKINEISDCYITFSPNKSMKIYNIDVLNGSGNNAKQYSFIKNSNTLCKSLTSLCESYILCTDAKEEKEVYVYCLADTESSTEYLSNYKIIVLDRSKLSKNYKNSSDYWKIVKISVSNNFGENSSYDGHKWSYAILTKGQSSNYSI